MSAGAERDSSRKGLQQRLSWLAGPALLFLLSVGFYWKLVLTDQYTWLDSPDLVYMEVPRFQFQMSQWHRRHFPLWDPYQWCGQPFLGQIVGAAYPLNWPFFLLPFDRNGKIQLVHLHWYFVIVHFLGALFCYWFCRDLKRSRAASILGGLVFPLSGFFGIFGWPQVMGGILWAPLIFLFLLRAVRGHQPAASAALSGMFLGIAWLSGHHEVPIYLSVAAAGTWIFYILRSAKPSLAPLRLASIAAVFMTLTSGLQTLPGYEYGKLAKRWVGLDEPVSWDQAVPYSVHTGFSFAPGSIAGVVIPWVFPDGSQFVGLVGASLALLAVLTRWSDPSVRLFSAMAVLALLLSMAAYNIFHGMLYAVLPLFGKARVPPRVIALFDFAMAPLAAYGMDSLREAGESVWVRRLGMALAAVGGGVFAVVVAAEAVRKFDPDEYVMFSAMAALSLAAVLMAWQNRRFGSRVLISAMLFLLLMELGLVSARFPNRFDKHHVSLMGKLRETADIAAFLKLQAGPVRVDFNDTESNLNFGDWEGIEVLRGYGAGMTANLVAQETHTERTQDLLAVTYTVSRKPTRPGQEPVFQGASGLIVYRNPGAYPRAWAVHETVRVRQESELQVAIQDRNFDLRTKAPMLQQPPQLEKCGGQDQVRTSGRGAAAVRLEARMNCRGMVVLADTWYPGWVATVDGRRASIYEPYEVLRGVVVEAGWHHIEMRYRPRSVYWGAWMTAIGILGACGLVLRGSIPSFR